MRRRLLSWAVLLIVFVFSAGNVWGQSASNQKDFPSTTTWTIPSGVYHITVEVWGAGGGGGGARGYLASAGGGGGGGYAYLRDYPVVPGDVVTVTVGTGGAGGRSWLDGLSKKTSNGGTGKQTSIKVKHNNVTTTIAYADGGGGASSTNDYYSESNGGSGGGAGGVTGTITHTGGNGGNSHCDNATGSTYYSGGGGGCAARAGNGGNASGSTAGHRGSNGSSDYSIYCDGAGAAGRNGRTDGGAGSTGNNYGGGGSGGYQETVTADGRNGGAGANGYARIRWVVTEPHTVTFNLNGGSGSKPTTGDIRMGQKYSEVCGTSNWVPTRTGYTFKGWCVGNASGNGLFIGPDAACTQNAAHTVYAIWEKNLQTVLNVCPNADDVYLNAPSGYPNYSWSPTTTLSSSSVQNPKVNVSAIGAGNSETYTCSYEDNFTKNYNFSLGNTCFYSDYTYSVPAGNQTLVPEGLYTICTNSNTIHPSFNSVASFGGDNGYLMVVNGSDEPSDIVWEQTVRIEKNTNYSIKTKVVSVGSTSEGKVAQLVYYVNGEKITSNVFNVNSNGWMDFNAEWGSGNNSFATIQIKNMCTSLGGNDFAIDNTLVTTSNVSMNNTVTVNVYPNFSAGSISSTGQTICKGTTINQIGSSSPATGGDGSITYKWQVSTNGGSYTDINNSNSATFNPSSYSNGGTYTFKRLAKDGACNDWTAASNTYTLTVNAPAVTLNDISASASTVCKGSDVTLTASTSSSTGTVTYKWNANNSTANPLSVNPTVQTTYTVTATATDGSCTVTDTKSKTINVYPDFSAGAIASTGETICKNGTPSAIGSTTAASGGNGSITYKWQVSTNGGSYTDIASSNSATFTPSAYKGTGGTYTFKRLAKDGACQTDWAAASNTYTLTVNAPAVTLNEISASATTVCSGSSVTLTASTSSNTGTVTYKWSANNSTDNPLTVNPTAQTTYTVTATATVGSCTATATKSKTVNVYPTFSAGAISSTGEEISVGETASEIGSTTAATGGNGSISYQWFAEESLIEGATSASYTPGETYTGVPGTYTFTRKAKDGACADWTLSENSYVLTVTNSIFEAVTDRGNIAACETVESNESFIDQNGQKVNRPAMSQYGELLNSSECEIQNYIISFDNNNGQDSMSAVSVGKGTSITLPSNTLTRTNCTFKEWNTERSGCGTVVADGATFATDSNVTLYAQWHSYCPGAAHTSINESGNASRIDSVKDHQNNWYEVVQVGSQCWLKENMRCTTSPKTLNTLVVMDKSESNHLPKAYYYDNDNSSVRPNGLLYNWYAAVDSSFESLPTETVDFLNRRGICPEGWHVPSNEDWNVLEDYLVGSPISRDLSSDISLYGQSSLNAIAGGCRWAEETNPEGPGYYDGSKRNSTGLSIVPTGYFCENTFHFLNEYMGVEADESLIMTGFQAATYVKEPSLGVVTRMIGCGDMLSFLSLATIGIVHANDGDGADGYCVRCIRNDVTIGAVTKTDSTINSLTIRTAFTANKAVTSGTVCAYTDASCTTPVGTCATIAANASSPVTATITGLAHNSKYYVKVTVNTANGTDSKIAGPFGTRPIIDTISFVPDGGTGTMATQSVVRGVSTPIKANAYSHTNWQFLGWNDACDGKGTNYANQANITTNGNVTLYAQWHSWCTGTSYSSNERGNSRIDSVKDHQNNWYKVVQIGNQCWLKENMRATTSPTTGHRILNNPIVNSMVSKSAGWYSNDSTNYSKYGVLYNWCAAVDTFYAAGGKSEIAGASDDEGWPYAMPSGNRRGICPAGWHVPTVDEWLTMFQTVAPAATDLSATQSGWGATSTDVAVRLSSGCEWTGDGGTGKTPNSYSNPNRNNSGFSSRPVGCYTGAFGGTGGGNDFWSATPDASLENKFATTPFLSGAVAGVYIYGGSRSNALSVRCVRD